MTHPPQHVLRLGGVDGVEPATRGDSRLRYRRHQLEIRDRDAIDALLRTHEMAIEVVVHTGAQPSHDWPVRKSFSDLDVNAVRTLIVPDAARRPPLTRWNLQPGHTYYDATRLRTLR